MPTITPQLFVQTYLEQGADISNTAEALGTSYANVYARVVSYRKRGIKLPIHRARGTTLPVTELNDMIKQYKSSVN